MSREILKKEVAKVAKKHTFEVEEIKYTKVIGVVAFSAWLLGCALAIYLLGHLIAIAIFSLSYMKWRGRSWAIASAATVIITTCIYVLLPLGFNTELYQGVISELIFRK